MLDAVFDIWGTILVIGAVIAVVGGIIKFFVEGIPSLPNSEDYDSQCEKKEKTPGEQGEHSTIQPENYRKAEYNPEEFCFMKDCISPERCMFCANAQHFERGTKVVCTLYNVNVDDNCVCDKFYDRIAAYNKKYYKL